MVTGIYFTLLLSLATGLQFPLEYHYDYIGQISTGIPELRTQVSAVGIRANLTIQISSKTDAVAKLSDVQIGVYNDDVDCALRNYAPIEFSPLADKGAEMEEPFHFKLTDKEGFVMSVPESEVEWVTNIKKSVIEMFIIQPILANFNDKFVEQIGEAAKFPVAFEVEEESLIGRCFYQYTITKVPQKKIIKMDEEIAKFLTYDIQRNIGVQPSEMEINAPDLEDVLWLATRSMDLSNCQGIVLAQRETMGATSFEGHSQNKYLAARSSVGQYLLRGMPGDLRMDRAIVEGAYISNLLGLQMEKLLTLTNQTMYLKTAKLIETPLDVGKTKQIHTWRFEVASPFFDPGPIHHQPWINFYGNISVNPSVIIPLMPETFLTGKVMEHVKVQELRVKVYELLGEVVFYLLNPSPEPSVGETPYDSAAGIIGHNMMLITRALSGITEDEMNILSYELFAQLDQRHHVMQMLFMDACIASGDTVAVNEVLKLMMRKPNSLVPDIRSATLMMAIGHNIAAPTLLQLLHPYVTSLNVTLKPLQTSATLLNFATAANRLCFNLDTYNTSSPQLLFGRAMCDPASISNLYLPIFAKGLKESPKTWQKAIYMHALANLKLGPTIDIFKLYVTGESTPDITLRSAAIFALSRQYQRDAARDMVFETLMPVMEDQDEDPGLRQDAFMVLLTWHPNTPWWHAMARLTWYEPFGPFAALIYFTIESMAKMEDPKYKSQSEIASLVLPLAKQFSPPFHYSYKRFYSKFLPDEKINTLIEYSWVTNLENSLPKDLFFFIVSNFGGLNVDLFEMSGLTRGMQKDVPSFVELLQSLWMSQEDKEEEVEAEPSPEEDANKKIVEDLLLDMKVQFKQLIDTVIPNELYLNLKFFKNIQYFMPINDDVITGAFGKGLGKLIYHLESGLFLNLNKYLVPVYNEYYLPTEVGLPLIHTDMASLITFGEGHLLLNLKGGPKNATIYDVLKSDFFRLECHLNSKVSEKVISKHTVLLPWSDITVEAGVDHVKAINIPIRANITYFNLSVARKFGAIVRPIFNKQPQAVIYGHTMPYTSIGDLVPVTNITNNTDFKPIAIEKSRRPIVEEEYSLTSDFTGLNAKFQWDSDGNFPATKGYILEFLRNPTKFLSLLFHPTAKFWKGAVVYDPVKSRTKSAEFSVVLVKVFRKENLSSNRTFHPNQKVELSAVDTEEERVEKLHRNYPESNFRSIRLTATWKSDIQRVWDLSAMFRSTRHIEGLVVKYTSNFFLLFNNIPNYFKNQFKMCMESDVEVPDIPEVITFKARMEARDLIVPKCNFIFFGGPTCTDTDFSTLSAKLRISEERRHRLNRELALECNIDVHDPLIGFRTTPTFDKLSAIWNYRNTTPEFARKLGWNLDQFLLGLMFPKITNYYATDDDPKKIVVNGRRNINDDGWAFRANKPYEKTVGYDIRVPFFMTQIMPYKGFFPVNGSYIPTLPPPDSANSIKDLPQCILQSNKVKTFSGEKLSVDLTSCWTLLSTSSDKHNWMLFVRLNPATNKSEIKYANNELNVIAYVSSDQAKVNGEPVNSPKVAINNGHGEPIFVVNRKKIGFIMSAYDQLKVKVSSSNIIVMPSLEFRGKLEGLCGKWDDSSRPLWIEPSSCAVKDPKLLTASWTSTRDCSSTKLTDLKRKLQNALKNCPKEKH